MAVILHQELLGYVFLTAKWPSKSAPIVESCFLPFRPLVQEANSGHNEIK